MTGNVVLTILTWHLMCTSFESWIFYRLLFITWCYIIYIMQFVSMLFITEFVDVTLSVVKVHHHKLEAKGPALLFLNPE